MGSGQNLTPVNCRDGGWGDVCITRVLKTTYDGNEVWLRSCVAPAPMTCESGYMESGIGTGFRREVWTLCCDTDNCNNNDPRDVLTTQATTDVSTTDSSDGISCVYCTTAGGFNMTAEDEANCEQGINWEGDIMDCEAEGWGSRCISRVYKSSREGEEKEWWIRSCLGPPPMTCEAGYVKLDNGDEYWTDCCDEDNCNIEDPRDGITTEVTTTETEEPPTDGIRCVMCTTAGGQGTDEEIANCEKGENLEDTSTDCEADGWGSSCIARVYKQYDGSILWIRSCLAAPPMTCDAGHVQLESGAEYWTLCCDEDNCNTEDPRDPFTTTTTTTSTTTRTSTTTLNGETTTADGNGGSHKLLSVVFLSFVTVLHICLN